VTAPPVPLAELRAAALALRAIALRTPLLEAPDLGRRAGAPVALKCEHLQSMGAFKIRGASWLVAQVARERPGRGVITYSSGNHGQAVAAAARRLGLRAVVVMPETAPRVKVEGVRRLGGEVVYAGTTSAARRQRAEAMAAEEGLAIIPPFDHPAIIAGQASCGLEILEQMPEVRTILVPVGGGGLAAGITAAVAALRPEVRVVAVEPEGAAKYAAAVRAGRPVPLARTASVADGLLPQSVGELPFAVLAGRAAPAQVSEAAIAAAVKYLHRELRLVVEPSGAATTAALLDGVVRPDGPTVAVVSGGNVDSDLFARLVA